MIGKSLHSLQKVRIEQASALVDQNEETDTCQWLLQQIQLVNP